MQILGWLLGVIIALTSIDYAFALQSPMNSSLKSDLISPQVDCPMLPEPFRSNREFDKLFRQAVQKHWRGPLYRDKWCWLKAQCAAESSLKPRATSPVGAKGICQFMKPTLEEVSKQLGRNLSPYDARDGIEAGAVYMQNLRKQVTSPRPSIEEKEKVAIAGFNAGLGSVWCAQRKGKGVILWKDISRFLHECTGRHAKETIGYVAKISRFNGFPIDPIPKKEEKVPTSIKA